MTTFFRFYIIIDDIKPKVAKSAIDQIQIVGMNKTLVVMFGGAFDL